jgi:hypothetical protein
MVLISVTRLRVGSFRYLPAFLLYVVALRPPGQACSRKSKFRARQRQAEIKLHCENRRHEVGSA